MVNSNNKVEGGNKKRKTSLEVFVDSLNENEKELLSSYLESQLYESLSEKFDQALSK